MIAVFVLSASTTGRPAATAADDDDDEDDDGDWDSPDSSQH